MSDNDVEFNRILTWIHENRLPGYTPYQNWTRIQDIDLRSGFVNTYDLLGEGFSGKVFAAGPTVALKQIKPKTENAREATVAKAKKEVAISSALNHPNIVRTIDVQIMESGYVYILMDRCGQNLKQYTKLGFLSWPVASKMAHDVSEALVYLEQKRIIHRDITHNNILHKMDGSGWLICDFGVARVAEPGAVMTSDTKFRIFTAPERVANSYEPAADVYSLGVVLLFCVFAMYNKANVFESLEDVGKYAVEREAEITSHLQSDTSRCKILFQTMIAHRHNRTSLPDLASVFDRVLNIADPMLSDDDSSDSAVPTPVLGLGLEEFGLTEELVRGSQVFVDAGLLITTTDIGLVMYDPSLYVGSAQTNKSVIKKKMRRVLKALVAGFDEKRKLPACVMLVQQ